MMDKIQRIKRYLQDSKRESTPLVPIDLSKIVDNNHYKTFATKEEVVREFERIISMYDFKLAGIKKNVDLSDSQIIGNIEKLNLQIADRINGVIKKAESDKLELEDSLRDKLENSINQLNEKINLEDSSISTLIDETKSRINGIEDVVQTLRNQVSEIKIPKEVKLKAGKDIRIDKKEDNKEVEYTITSTVKPSLSVLQQMRTGVQQIIAGSNISISPTDGKGTVTISSTASGASVAGSTFSAGYGIDITGITITNTLPGVSLQAGNNISIEGVTINAVVSGSTIYAGNGILIEGSTVSTTFSGISLTDNLGEGVSNFYYRPDRFVGTGGVSVSYTGKTLTIYGLSTALNTNLVSEGTSNFYYRPSYFRGTGGVSVSISGKTVTIYGLSSALNTNQITEGTSNFYYKPAYLIGTGGVSISISGKTVTVYGLSTALDQTTLGLSSFGEKSYNSLTDLPDLTVYAKGTSLFGLYILGTSFHSAVTVADSTTIDLGISSNQAITASVIQTGLGLSALGEKSYNSLDNKLGFVGTGGVSVSLSGSTYTIYGLSTAINSDQVSEGNSNFYYKGTYFAGIGGASVTVAGKTVTIYAQSTGSPAWGDITGDLSSQTDLYAELVTKLSGSSTTDLLNEGVSNFYYKPSYFTGTGGVSISIAGKTVTVYGLSSAINSNQVSEGTSNFYYRVDRLTSDTGISVYKNGVTAKIGVVQADINTNNITEGNSGLFYSIARFNSSFATKNTNDLTEGTSNFYYNPTGFVGTGGVSVSVVGKTVIVYGLSTAYNTDQITQGNSNFYYNPLTFLGTGGVSVSVNGKTLTLYGLSSALNTNQISEGTSNFYYVPTSFVGSNGTSVSVTGRTITIYSPVPGAVSAAGASGEIQYNDGGNLGATSLLRFSAFEETVFVKNVKGNNSDISITNDVGGHVSLTTNNGISGTNVGNIYLTAGSGIDNANAGDIRIFAGNGASSFDSGYISIYSGSNYNSGIGGDLNLGAGAGSDANSGSVYISAGTGNAGDANGGNVYIDAGTKSGNGIDGYVLIRNANYGAILGTTYLTAERTYAFPDASGSFALLEAIKGTGGVSVSVSGASITIFGLSRGIQLSKSVYLEGVTNTDLIPFLRVEQNMLLEKTVYDVSGGTQWVGQVQKWNNAQGASKYNTQAADSGVTTTLTVTSYSGATVLTGEYLAIKGSSIYGGISWLLVNIYYKYI